MAPTVSATHELFLVLEDITERLPEYRQGLSAVTDAAENGPFLLGVDVYYRADTDIGLLVLRFDRRTLNGSKREWVVQVASAAAIPVLDPERLGANDRSVFYDRYLQSYGLRIDDIESPGACFDELAHLLGLRTTTRTPSSPPLRAPIAAPSEITLELDGETPMTFEATVDPYRRPSSVLPERPDTLREALDPVPPAASASSDASLEIELAPPMPRGKPIAHLARRVGNGTGGHRAIAQRESVTSVELPKARVHAAARGKARASADRLPTIPGRPLARASTPPELATETSPRDGLFVRFQRGDTWVQARVRNLNTREARLASSAPPPLGSAVRIALALGEHGVSVTGLVVSVVTAEASVDGSACFRVEFTDVSTPDRERLVRLLREARDSSISLSPPPPRRNTRFSISWPVTLASGADRFNAAALDISKAGLFVATTILLRAGDIAFGIPLDRRGPGIQGRARVARAVTEDMARERGLERGYGLQIDGLDDQDRRRFVDFLQRVRKRSQRHVAVAAAGRRQQMLAQALTSAGYAVTSADSVALLLERAHFATRPPDVAVLDASIGATAGVRREFETTFAGHQVPFVDAGTQAAHVTRHAVDRILAVDV